MALRFRVTYTLRRSLRHYIICRQFCCREISQAIRNFELDVYVVLTRNIFFCDRSYSYLILAYEKRSAPNIRSSDFMLTHDGNQALETGFS